MVLRRAFAAALAAVIVTAASAASTAFEPPEHTAGAGELLLVLGDGLAAGLGDFSLSADLQDHAFPVLLARRLGADFVVPRIEAPGLGNPPGLPPQPVFLPAPGQTMVLDHPGPIHNLAVPGFTVADVVGFRPSGALVHRDDATRTLAHLVLRAARPPELPRESTPLEIAVARQPHLVLVVLGYQEAVDAALAGDAAQFPPLAEFSTNYDRILSMLTGAGATVVAATVPDPLDSAYFSSLETATSLLRVEAPLLRDLYGLENGDRLSLPALLEIGSRLTERDLRPELPLGSVLPAGSADRLSQGVEKLNAILASVAAERGALLFDLHRVFRSMREEGVEAGERRLTSNYLGGLFLLNGFYPGRTGHALLANELLGFVRDRLMASGPPYDLGDIAKDDPAALARSGGGSLFHREDLEMDRPPPLPPPPGPQPGDPPVVGYVAASTREGCRPPEGVPACGLPPRTGGAIELPPDLQLFLDLNPETSYYGDAIRAVDCPDDRPVPGFEKFPPFGSCHRRLFGGLAMSNVAVQGKVKITFSEPDGDRVRFTIEHPGGLRGQDGRLAAPQLFTLPLRHSVLGQAPGLVSSGVLDLKTGEVLHLEYFTTIFNTALIALKNANPALPLRPLGFPGPAGTAIARFTQRPDGRLDFSLYATQFLPLGVDMGGSPVRLPLPLCSPDLECASVVARGTSLHPNLFLTTEPTPAVPPGRKAPYLPENALRELVTLAAESRFGDLFDLAAPELGGSALGETPLLGRLQVQFGPRFGHRLPVAFTTLAPGGLQAPLPELIERLPPGVLPGLAGFSRTLSFPEQEYELRRLRFTSDPWNLALGVVDTRTGQLSDKLLHRGFVVQDLMFQLLEAEPCTPKTSFCYFGDAAFETMADGGIAFGFRGGVRIPYPAGYRFPAPRPGESFVVRESSVLHPFVQISARRSAVTLDAVVAGTRGGVSQEGDRVRLRYVLPCAAGAAGGEEAAHLPFDLVFLNDSGNEAFRGDELVWLDCGADGTATFTANGTWSADPNGGRHSLSGQLHPTAEGTWAALLIDGGATAEVLVLAAPAGLGENGEAP